MTGSGGTWRLAVVTVAWVAAERVLAYRGARYLPDAVAQHLTLQTWLLTVQLLTGALALTALALWVPSPRVAIGLVAPTRRALLDAALWAPIVFSLTTFLAFRAALPTLLEEAMSGGMARARENAGEIARSLTETEVAITVAWGIVVAPLVEELVFRGGLWSSLQRAFRAAPRPAGEEVPPSLDQSFVEDSVVVRCGRALRDFARSGGAATLVSAVVFAALHADLRGGAGILRVGVAFGLGLATGMARHASGTLVAPILLHVLFNAMSVSGTRRWVVNETFPMKQQVPTIYAWLALSTAVLLVFLWILRRAKRPA